MSKIIVLATDDLIDGVPRVAGQVVTVPDGYPESKIRRVISSTQTVAQQAQSQQAQLTWRSFVEMFLEQYPEFAYVDAQFPDVVAAVSVRPALIQRLMSEPQLIMEMLSGGAENAMGIISQYPSIGGGDD